MKTTFHGFHVLPAIPKAMNHGFYTLRELPKAMNHGFYTLREMPKAMNHGFYTLREMPKAMNHGFRVSAEVVKAGIHGFRDVRERMKHLRTHVRSETWLRLVRLSDMEPTLPAAPSLTHHQRLAEEIMRDLAAVAAKIPYLESPHHTKAAFVRSHGNVPIPFLQTATVAVEQTDELQAVRKLDPAQAHDTLEYVEAFRPVIHQFFALGRRLKFSVTLRRSQLAFQSLQIYAIAQGLASDKRDPNIAAHVANLRRDLGPRGRPRKTAVKP